MQDDNDNEPKEQNTNRNHPRRSWNERLNRKHGKNTKTQTPGVVPVQDDATNTGTASCPQERSEPPKVGDIVAFPVKFLHPRKVLKAKFGDEKASYKGIRLYDATVVTLRESKKVRTGAATTLCVVVTHDEFRNDDEVSGGDFQQLYVDASRVTIQREGKRYQSKPRQSSLVADVTSLEELETDDLEDDVDEDDSNSAVTALPVTTGSVVSSSIVVTEAPIDLESGGVMNEGLLAPNEEENSNTTGAVLEAPVSVVTAHVVNEKEEQELAARIKRLEEADTRVERPEQPNAVEIVQAVRVSDTKTDHGKKRKGRIALLVLGVVVLLVIIAIVVYFVVGRSSSHSHASYDDAYIHPGCSNGYEPDYYYDSDWKKDHDGTGLAWGTGWYCNDDKDVSSYGPNDFDKSYIHSSCHAGVEYDHTDDAWYCKDDLPSS